MDFKAIDEKPVHFFFLIVAPPLEVSNQYLPVLGKIAQFSKEPDVPGRLLELTEPKQFLGAARRKGRLGGRCGATRHACVPASRHSHSIVAGGFELTS